jgi:hypothetical protein
LKAGYIDGFVPVCQGSCAVGEMAYRLLLYAI